MTIPGSYEEQVAIFKKQVVAELQEESLEIERHTKMTIEAASYQATKQKQQEKEALEARNQELVKEIMDLQSKISQASRFQDLPPRETGPVDMTEYPERPEEDTTMLDTEMAETNAEDTVEAGTSESHVPPEYTHLPERHWK